MALVVQTFGVVGTLTATTIAVRSYLISNKRAEEARKRELETRQAQLFMGLYQSLCVHASCSIRRRYPKTPVGYMPKEALLEHARRIDELLKTEASTE